MPATQWRQGCFPGWEFGGSWLAVPGGAAAGAFAVAVLLASAGGDATARRLLRRALSRAWLAGAAAALYGVPLPFGPAVPHGVIGAVHWSWLHQTGAVGALTSCAGALWWARALGQRLTERTWRRSARRRAQRARPECDATGRREGRERG
ncbi:MAG TPA: hypothetical protein VFZ65_23735 [Planctomycetota bacterium]|nr:hypothetical protein [Planctomycetota bacterium]